MSKIETRCGQIVNFRWAERLGKKLVLFTVGGRQFWLTPQAAQKLREKLGHLLDDPQ